MKHISKETYTRIIKLATDVWKHNNGWGTGVWIEHDKFLEACEILNTILKENDNDESAERRTS